MVKVYKKTAVAIVVYLLNKLFRCCKEKFSFSQNDKLF